MSRKKGTLGLLPDLSNQVGQHFAFAPPQGDAQNRATKPYYKMEAGANGSYDIYIYGSIGGWFGINAQDFVDELKTVNADTLNVHINSPGGSVFDAVAIYNSLVNHKANVNVSVDALAASAASFIAQAGDSITMSQGSMMMIHDAMALTMGNAADHRVGADLLDKMSGNIANLYALRAGEDQQAWRDRMLAETWYTAQEAVDANLADTVAGTAVEDPNNQWDLSVFNFAGRKNAPDPMNVVQPKEKPVSGTQTDSKNTSTTPPTPPTPPAPPTAPSPPHVDPQGGFTGVLINGVLETDPGKVQSYITAAENFARETRDNNRRAFVASLASSNKILATQIGTPEQPGLEAFALSLTPESYEMWVKTWDVAPGNSLLEKHSGPSNEDGKGGAGRVPAEAAALADEIAVKQNVVKQFRATNMSQEAIEKTESWKFLVANSATSF